MTGLHTGHAWIRGNGEIPLRAEDVTVAMVLRDAGYRTAVIGKWGLGAPGTTGQPDRKGFDYSFGFLDHRHAHRQFTDHLYRNGAASRGRSRPATTSNDLFTREAAAFIERDDARPFFLYLNYTVPHAELRVPEDSLAPFRGTLSREAVRQRGGRRASRPAPDDAVARLPIAADAARRVRRDDHADGPRHRPAGRSADDARARPADAGHVHQRQRPAPGRRRRSGVLQELRRAARHQARSLRRRHSRADDRALAGHDPRRHASATTPGRTGTCLPTLAEIAGAQGARRPRRHVDGARASRASRSRRTSSSTGSSTSAAFSRPCGWATGRRCGWQRTQPLELYNLATDPRETTQRRRRRSRTVVAADRGVPEDGADRVAELADKVSCQLPASSFQLRPRTLSPKGRIPDPAPRIPAGVTFSHSVATLVSREIRSSAWTDVTF